MKRSSPTQHEKFDGNISNNVLRYRKQKVGCHKVIASLAFALRTVLVWVECLVDLVNIFLTFSSITKPNLVALFHTVKAHVGALVS